MQYKTIVLALLQQRQEMLEQLRKTRMLLPTLDYYAKELKTDHEAWISLLWRAKPGTHPKQLATEALEMALKGLEDLLPSASPWNDSEALSLEEAVAFIISHTSPA